MKKIKYLLSKNKNQKGSTFIETILYITIYSIILVIFLQMFTAIIDIQLESEARSSVHQDGRYILERLTYDIRRAESINTPSAPGEQSSTLQLVINGVNFTYNINNGYLTLTNDLGTDNLNSVETTVSGVNFTRLGGTVDKNTIKISLNLISKTLKRSGPQNETFETAIGLR